MISWVLVIIGWGLLLIGMALTNHFWRLIRLHMQQRKGRVSWPTGSTGKKLRSLYGGVKWIRSRWRIGASAARSWYRGTWSEVIDNQPIHHPPTGIDLRDERQQQAWEQLQGRANNCVIENGRL